MKAIMSAKNGVREKGIEGGSALILVVVLTSLLAIVGVMFVMVSRMDRMATSGISEDKQFDLAVDTVVGKICGQLAWDVPGTVIPDSMIFPVGMIFPEDVEVFPDGLKHPEYHDYPGPEDRWLAASEPNNVRTWAQISDVTGYIARMGWSARNIPIAVIPDDRAIVFDPVSGRLLDQPADADGDGIADSKWIMLEGVTSSRGEPIYVAARVTDNGGKMNVNDGFQFNPFGTDVNSIDGTSPLQINLLALANRPGVLPTPADVDALLLARANYGVNLYPYRLDLYEDNVIWRYGELTMPYTPFDISDELELRNRFLLNQRDIDARIERLGWTRSFINGVWQLDVPIGQGGSNSTADDWFARANESVDRLVPDPDDNRYDYRHLATTYSMDRIINPLGSPFYNGKMANINTLNAFDLMRVIKSAIYNANATMVPFDAERTAGQVAANIVDFRDEDSEVTVVWENPPAGSGTRYYGYERPCIYISQVTGVCTPAGRPPYPLSYAVELYKPYLEDNTVIDWRLMIDANGVAVPITWPSSRQLHVVLFDGGRNDLAGSIDPNAAPQRAATYVSLAGKTVYLQRSPRLVVPKAYITVDSFTLPTSGAAGGWLAADGASRSYRRDISRHKCIRRLWDMTCRTYSGATLGNNANAYVDADSRIVQAHPYLDPNVYTSRYAGTTAFKNVGEIGMVFDANGYDAPSRSTEADLRLDLRKSQYARLFNYLTVVDPTTDGRDSNGDGRPESPASPDTAELKVPGRININTAPAFVLEQLPWIAPAAVGPKIVDMVVACRDKLQMSGAGAP
ncbi:MAG: hypothetical protein JXN61_17200, partial [Sedimentisphaerales bacterium]|nr:hypothetical protein [Sedimentisphaerales bacterium]